MKKEIEDLREFVRLSKKFGNPINLEELSDRMNDTDVQVEYLVKVKKRYNFKNLGLTNEELKFLLESKDLYNELEEIGDNTLEYNDMLVKQKECSNEVMQQNIIVGGGVVGDNGEQDTGRV